MVSNGISQETPFFQARNTFLSSLSQSEQTQFKNCGSITEVIESLQSLEQLSKAKSRLLPYLAKVDSFGENLSPYFKILEIFCGSHPEWANIALGALRLILQVPHPHAPPGV